MAQIRKLETEFVIASSGDLFLESFSNSPHQLLDLQPEVFKGCDLLEGEFGKPGFVVQWIYNLEGKTSAKKEKFETIDKKNRILKLVDLEGDYLDSYKTMEITLQVLTKVTGVDVVKWSLEYEKVDEGVPDPHFMLEAAVQVTKKIDMRISSH